ncbi:GTPase Era [Campylobacter sp. MIT 99-7217]|uniref:GTPase Era n=1 Tax=Campylobacter sp. MIT 99-7217 TaxID=535091 RepID=UPI001157FBB9|nr:GTPase Era [Campylobacter sp. MIT 99-7217]TQR34696.1 GTPase Era [Campylobacter sp. MIT 99-7217]
MKSGFVSIIGRTNAGKSSIINALLDAKITLVSHKQNATRRKIKAIIMHNDDQIIITDTPGLHKSDKLLNQMLINSALKSINDCDLILFVVSVFDELKDYEEFLSLEPKVPHLLVLNKVDLVKNEALLKKLSEYAKFSEHFKAIIPFSAKQKTYKKTLLDEVVKHLEEHAYFYDPSFLTPSSEKEIYKDFILEAVFESVSEELPYCVESAIKSIKDTPNALFIEANLITDTPSHKAMLIGKDGLSLKRIGKNARKKIEKLAEKKVMLRLFVQVKKAWQKDENFLKSVLDED